MTAERVRWDLMGGLLLLGMAALLVAYLGSLMGQPTESAEPVPASSTRAGSAAPQGAVSRPTPAVRAARSRSSLVRDRAVTPHAHHTHPPRQQRQERAVGGSRYAMWMRVAECESGGNPRAVSRTGKFRGLLQFSLSSWRAVGMSGDPIDYPASVQIAAGERLLRLQGPGAWPTCGRYLR